MIDSQEFVKGHEKSSTSSAVQVVNVSKKFSNNLAANNINLTIEEGEFFSFLGPSGCGKTTLLRMIAGFENPTTGKILIAGTDMDGVPPHKRPVNMVFQNYALFPHLTIGENVAFGLKSARRYNQAEISQRVKDSLELVRLSQLADRLPSQISGGQQQRAALARAVVNSPAVLLLDEPLSALDPQIREEMQVELARLQKRLGMTFIMVTHDQNEALALSTRIAVFRQGNLEQVASPESIYKSPKTLFVAKFIGQTNVIEGEIVDYQERDYKVFIPGGLEVLALIKDARLPKGSRAAVLIKPHAIRFVESGDQSELNGKIFDAIILNKSFQGTNTEYLVSLEGKLELRVSMINELFSSDRQICLESNAKVCISSEACEILPLET